ncbi:hypothetical protein DHL47_02810 [Streptococcus panodentis]|uniref:Uncharacterized protein n=1 Tax=Streptococcus panodentis TaxID=1581472 RepID=A0ABS5AUN4_9STRE|nr:hypothetical protein [Streptococcus panodentis]
MVSAVSGLGKAVCQLVLFFLFSIHMGLSFARSDSSGLFKIERAGVDGVQVFCFFIGQSVSSFSFYLQTISLIKANYGGAIDRKYRLRAWQRLFLQVFLIVQENFLFCFL